MSNQTKRETNCSMNNKWNDVNTHNYMQFTKYNSVYTDACVVHIIRWARTQRALLYTWWCCFTPNWLKIWILSSNISIVIHERTSLSFLSSSTPTCPSLSSAFPSTSCTPSCTLSSTTWSSWKACATVLLRQQGEWRRLRGLHLPHRLWAQLHDLQRAQRLIGFFLLHCPVIGPGHGWRDTRQVAHRGTPRTSRLLRTRRHVSTVVFDRAGKTAGEKNVDQSVGFGAKKKNMYSAHSICISIWVWIWIWNWIWLKHPQLIRGRTLHFLNLGR